MPSVPIDTLRGKGFFSGDYSPNTPWPRLTESFGRLPQHYSFDLERLRTQIRSLTRGHPFRPFPLSHNHSNKKYYGYQGICLTSQPGSDDPLYEGLKLYSGPLSPIDKREYFSSMAHMDKCDENLMPLSELNFTEKTEICNGYLSEVIGKFKSPHMKIKITKMKPRGVLPPHVDFPYYKGIRLHAALETNEACWIEIEGERYHVPADGNFYWMDSGKYHAAWNDGKTDKIHLCINLSVYLNTSGQLLNSPENSLADILSSNSL